MWKLVDENDFESVYESEEWITRNKSDVNLTINKIENQFELQLISSYSSSKLVVDFMDFKYFPVSYTNGSVEKSCFEIADYYCSFFCISKSS